MISWAARLFAQNAAFTWLSRTRNRDSVWAHIPAALVTNALWFASQYVLVKEVVGGSSLAALACVYTIATASGSVASHWLLKRVGL